MKLKTGTYKRNKIAIIGAGISGLITLKELLELDQEVVCFEKSGAVGGVFSQTKKGDIESKSQSYDSLLLTTSNYAMAYSCFPPPKGEPRHFWTKNHYHTYLQNFTKKFHLQSYIQFHTEIVSIEKMGPDLFKVTTSKAKGELKQDFFDGVCICSGIFSKENIPKALTKDSDQSIKITHSMDYKNNSPYHRKNVLCIGMGESGADIVGEISKVAEASHLLLRESPPPVIPKYPSKNHTNDAYTTAFTYDYYDKLKKSKLGKKLNAFYRAWGKEPIRHLNYKAKDKLTSTYYDFYERSHYDHDPLSRFLTKNEIALRQYAVGKLKMHFSEIAKIKNRKVFLKNGEVIENIDEIICNTGYMASFPFLESIKDMKNISSRDLYAGVFSLAEEGKLAFVGLTRPAQGFFPALSELQARLAALVMSGYKMLPEYEAMKSQIKSDKEESEDMFHREKNPNLVQYPFYANKLAGLIGCLPSRKMSITNPILFIKLYFGSFVANRFRLKGPGQMKHVSIEVIKSLPIAHNGASLAWGIPILSMLKIMSYFKQKSLSTKK